MVHRSESELTLDNILFEKRNKSYGAYYIRQIYNSHLGVAFLAAAVFFSAAIISPKVTSLLFGEEPEPEEEFKITEVILSEPPPIDPKISPPPPPPPPKMARPEPPKIKTTEFLPPEIEEDEKVIEEKVMPTVKELENSMAGEKTQEGETENLNQIINPGNSNSTVGDGDGEEIFEFVGEAPVFTEGDLIKFLFKNTIYPREALDKGIEGKLFVKFVIETDGSISDVKVLKGPEIFHKEAIRVVKLTDKKWTAGKNNGKPARVWKVLPVTFKMPDKK